MSNGIIEIMSDMKFLVVIFLLSMFSGMLACALVYEKNIFIIFAIWLINFLCLYFVASMRDMTEFSILQLRGNRCSWLNVTFATG